MQPDRLVPGQAATAGLSDDVGLRDLHLASAREADQINGLIAQIGDLETTPATRLSPSPSGRSREM